MGDKRCRSRGDPRDCADDDVAVLRPDNAALQIPGGGELFGLGQRVLSANWSCNPNDTSMLAVGATGLASGADTATALQHLYDPIPQGLGAPIPY